MKYIICSFALFFLESCSGKSGKKETQVNDSTVRSSSTSVTGNTDTLVIDKKSAVYYQPDSIQLEKWKKEVGDKDFVTVTDD